MEERSFAVYNVVRLPTPAFVNQFAEPFRCCDTKQLVLGDLTDAETYKNDIKRFLSVSPTVYPKQIDTGINNTLDILIKVLTDKIHKL